VNFTLKRTDYEADGILGTLTASDKNGQVAFASLEHAFDTFDGVGTFIPKLSRGTYTCQRRLSPHFGFEVFEVLNVPNFEGKPVTFIEIHPGNFNKDSDGCILVGTIRVNDTIVHSVDAFKAFMALQNGIDQFTLIVE
jgi:hypothetical protein